MSKQTVAVIIAGGLGTRFSSMTKQIASEHPDLFNGARDIPKPMAIIEGIPILEREIQCLVNQGFTDIILTVGYLADVIISYFGDGGGISRATGKPFNCHILYYREKTLLGNAGALFQISDKLTDDFLLLNADSIFDIDFNRIVNFHKSHHALATLFTHPNSHPYDSALLITDENHIVKRWLSKEDIRPQWYSNRVNAGLQVIKKSALEKTVQIGLVQPNLLGTKVHGMTYKIDLDRQILKPLCQTNCVFAFDSSEYVKDMGTPERFDSIVHDYESGTVQARNFHRTQKAIFIDRDGTINRYKGFLKDIHDFELVPDIAQGIRRINSSEYLTIVITNQPVIARGELTIKELNEIHQKMETLLGQEGAYIDGLYYCPHHPDKGYKGEIPELKIDCDCRKPKTGLIDRAVKDFNIDLHKSWFFGDGKNDIQCGQNAGTHTCLYIGPGCDPNHRGIIIPDLICESLNEFCDRIGI